MNPTRTNIDNIADVDDGEPVVVIHAEELVLVAELCEHIAGWLTFANPTTIAELNAYPYPARGSAQRLINELAQRATRLRKIAGRP